MKQGKYKKGSFPPRTGEKWRNPFSIPIYQFGIEWSNSFKPKQSYEEDPGFKEIGHWSLGICCNHSNTRPFYTQGCMRHHIATEREEGHLYSRWIGCMEELSVLELVSVKVEGPSWWQRQRGSRNGRWSRSTGDERYPDSSGGGQGEWLRYDGGARQILEHDDTIHRFRRQTSRLRCLVQRMTRVVSG